jgi:hypothetical protein
MKKLLALVLGLLLLVVPALAEETDLAALSLEELVALRERIDAEIAARIPVNEAPFYTGIYVVGRDIKAGVYVIDWEALQPIDGEISGKFEGNLFANEANFQENITAYRVIYSTFYNQTEGSWAITLTDGMVLTVTIEGAARIRSEDHAFWVE